MNDAHSQETAIFDAALQLPPEQRSAYLDEVCAGDLALRQRIDGLLGACEGGGVFLNGPAAPDLLNRSAVTPTEKAGDRIGRYKLLEQIGEGGCGVVYMAEQEEPVRRRVALKVIKLGMDTRSVIARFEAERQALAMMDHPNIAKVLDAGATETGRPYFVMELVRGIKITEYCDQLKLSTRQRLELFISVCQAVQHAHQKGIIHRDLKPSNILVTEHDGVAVPKIIDFGIAKATTDQPLTDKTLFTSFAQFIGTPAYTSPEQAGLGGLDIDTRSDIYSLGVLLYELLTGRPPFSPAEFQRSAIDEILRVIRETEPPRPSARLTTLNQRELTTVAQHRQIESAKLPALVRGDLDWIVMKCLEKDRTRRYETANGLAADIQRHLNHEAVAACPPSNVYRFQKLVRRNKLAFAAAAGIGAALVIGLSASTWMFFRESAALKRAIAAEIDQVHLRQQADLARTNEVNLRIRAQTEAIRREQIALFLKDTLEATGPSYARGRDTTMLREILDATATRVSKELTNQFEVQADLMNTIGMVYRNIGENQKAEAMFRQALSAATNAWTGDHPITADILRNLSGVLHRNHGSPSEAQAKAEQALEMSRRLWGNEHRTVAACLINLGMAFVSDDSQGDVQDDTENEPADTDGPKFAKAEQLIREGLALTEKLEGKESSQAASAWHRLGQTLYGQRKLDDAENALRKARRIWEDVLHEEHRELPWCFYDLSRVLKRKGDLAGAEAASREGWEKRKRLMGALDPDLRDAGWQLDSILKQQGKVIEREALSREWMELSQEAFSILQKRDTNANHVMANLFDTMGYCLSQQGDKAGAEKFYGQAVEMERRLHSNDHKHVALQLNHLGLALWVQQKWTEAQAAYQEELAIRRSLHTNASPGIANVLHCVAESLTGQKKFAAAEKFYSEAIEMERRLHSKDQKHVALLLNNLGSALLAQHKWTEAKAAFQEELTIRRSLDTNASPEIATALHNVAESLTGQKKFAEAEKFYSEALEMERRLHSNDQKHVALLLNHLGSAFFRQKKWTEAQAAYQEELAIRRSFTNTSPGIATTLHNVAESLAMQKKVAEAELFYRDAMEMEKALRTNEHHIASAYRNLAQNLERQGKLPDAEVAFGEALTLERQIHTNAHQDVAIALCHLAGVLYQEKKLEKAETFQREAVEAYRQSEPEGSSPQANALHDLAYHLEKTGKVAEAETYYRKALAMQDKLHEPSTGNALASLLKKQRRLSDVEALYLDRIETMRREGVAPSKLKMAVASMARFLRDQNRVAEAERFEREAAELARKTEPAERK